MNATTDRPLDVDGLRRKLRAVTATKAGHRSELPDDVTDERGHSVLLAQDLDLIASLAGEDLVVRQAAALSVLTAAAGELAQAAVLVVQGRPTDELLMPCRAVRRALLVAEQIGGAPL